MLFRSTFNLDSAIRDVADYAKAILNGLQSAWTQISALPVIANLNDDVKQTIVTSYRGVYNLMDSLRAATTKAEAQPIVEKIATYAMAGLSALAGIPGLPPTITVLISAAQIVLPVLQSLVGLVVATVEQIKAAPQAKAVLLAAPN